MVVTVGDLLWNCFFLSTTSCQSAVEEIEADMAGQCCKLNFSRGNCRWSLALSSWKEPYLKAVWVLDLPLDAISSSSTRPLLASQPSAFQWQSSFLDHYFPACPTGSLWPQCSLSTHVSQASGGCARCISATVHDCPFYVYNRLACPSVDFMWNCGCLEGKAVTASTPFLVEIVLDCFQCNWILDQMAACTFLKTEKSQ